MIYEIVSVTGIDGVKTKHVIIDNGDDTFVSFPADESNPNFVAFIEANPDAIKKVRAS
jgi:hypothetical protein